MKMNRSIWVGLALGLGSLVAFGCSDSQDGGSGSDAGCDGAKCDDATAEDLEGFNDPIALWLKENLGDDGTLDVGYLDMLRGVGTLEDCDESTIDSYIISDELLGTDGAFPRIVNTVCSDNRAKADMAFFALSFQASDGIDVDPRRVEMFSWDPTERRYRFYKLDPAAKSDTATTLVIEPSECQGCHLGPQDVEGFGIHMMPIMNELQAPWEHWHAEPISVNHTVSEATKAAPNYRELAASGGPFLKSAARLEQTIRNAFSQRVSPARIRERRAKPADIDTSMALLRPLFCDEQVTYVTEDGASGLLPSSSVIDDGFHSAYFAIMGTGWPWEWWNDRIIRLDPPGAPDAVNMMPVRGAMMVAYEKQLMSSRALKPEQVLRIRSLDWKTPALSSFRCDLWTNALPRVRENPPIELTDDMRNLTLMRALFDEILTLHPADFGIDDPELGEALPIVPSDPGKIIAMAEATPTAIEDLAIALTLEIPEDLRCEEDGGGVCEADLNELGAMIEVHFKNVEAGRRDPLNEARNARGCHVAANFPNKPFIPGLDCPGGGDPDPDTGGETGGGETGGTGGMMVSNCCGARTEAGCDDTTIQSCVCGRDSFCCDDTWDQVCVDEIAEFGCEGC